MLAVHQLAKVASESRSVSVGRQGPALPTLSPPLVSISLREIALRLPEILRRDTRLLHIDIDWNLLAFSCELRVCCVQINM